METITFDDFLKVDIRVGRIVRVEDFPKARKPALKLWIDFGPALGERKTSAQVAHTPREALLGRLVVAVVNFPPRQVADFLSEVLLLGVPSAEGAAGQVVLLHPERDVPLGGRMY